MNAVVFCCWGSCFVLKRMLVTVLASQAVAMLCPLGSVLWACLLGKTKDMIFLLGCVGFYRKIHNELSTTNFLNQHFSNLTV